MSAGAASIRSCVGSDSSTVFPLTLAAVMGRSSGDASTILPGGIVQVPRDPNPHRIRTTGAGGEVEDAPMCRQPAHGDARLRGHPRRVDARAHHQRLIALALVGEHRADRLDEAGPTQVCGMSPMNRGALGSRQTTSAHSFHAAGRRSVHQSCEQPERTVALAEPDERPDVAQLVGRVGVPAPPSRRDALDQSPRVAIEGALERRRAAGSPARRRARSRSPSSVGSKSPSSTDPGR